MTGRNSCACYVDLRHIAIGEKGRLDTSFRNTGTEAEVQDWDGRKLPPLNLGDIIDSAKVKVTICAVAMVNLLTTTTYAEAVKSMAAVSGNIGERHVIGLLLRTESPKIDEAIAEMVMVGMMPADRRRCRTKELAVTLP